MEESPSSNIFSALSMDKHVFEKVTKIAKETKLELWVVMENHVTDVSLSYYSIQMGQ